MKTLLLTDLHFNIKPRGLLEAQKTCIINIIENEKPDEVIIMGDLMMHRKPSPSVLLALKCVVDYIHGKRIRLTIIRGNHDSETMEDDGVTSLSLFDYCADVITHTWYDYKTKRAFIPHYEDEGKIKEDLGGVPPGYTIFGHFGYSGCLNSVGDADFNILHSNFSHCTYLGHIHTFYQKGLVTILGTPYSTNFGECEKENFYGILYGDGSIEFKPVKHGPRHIILDHSQVENSLEYLNDPNWFTMLRIFIDSKSSSIPYDSLDVDFLDIKWKTYFDEEDFSSYKPKRDLFSINEMIVEDYIESAKTTLDREDIMEGYSLLKHED
jgi:DNA repair exonuclease SbcCD nuclease subunit